ncbi:MAG: phosphate signaling complex protein PhoU [Luteolibacter sp.]|jgi:phosphate transport system protein|nr:phosphate signaling complex protein PhoU [Luteolibacter sp.]
MNQPHIFHEIDNSMTGLKDKILLMASLTRQNLERAIQALLTRDIDLARMVIGDDSDVDDLEVKIDQQGMDILIRFHPVASDLRLVITSMKTAHNLERISDHAVTIAKRARKICKSSEPLETNIIEPLYTMAETLLRDALLAYTDANTDLGEGLKSCDKQLDAAHKEVVALLSSRLENSEGRAESLLHLILVARSLERIGDLAVNIGEDSVFLSEARDIRHDKRKSSDLGENPA